MPENSKVMLAKYGGEMLYVSAFFRIMKGEKGHDNKKKRMKGGTEPMKETIRMILAAFMLLCLTGCSQKEASVVKTYEVTESELIDGYFENNKLVTIAKYYEMSDATWKTDDCAYQYRLEISGRMNNAAEDNTFVYLSNIKDITFDQAWKASGLSSNMNDYFKEEDAKLVAMK